MDTDKLSKALKPGTVLISPLREYTIIKALGAGGFGITYLVSGKVGNASVEFAIKEHFMASYCERGDAQTVSCSAPVRGQVQSSLRDFMAEATRLNNADVRHNSLVGINEVFEANNTAYYVMEYIKGESLRQYVANHPDGALDEDEAIEILSPVLDAMSVMHDAKITHLDIKPDNILLTTDLFTGKVRPVVIDFGLSKHYDEDGSPTSEINLHGCSEGYSPMEQYMGIREFSPTADVYSLAATLYFMLTGQAPLKASDMNSLVIRTKLAGICSLRVCEAIVDAMAPDRRHRTRSVAMFASDLGVALPNVPGVRVIPREKGFTKIKGETKDETVEAEIDEGRENDSVAESGGATPPPPPQSGMEANILVEVDMSGHTPRRRVEKPDAPKRVEIKTPEIPEPPVADAPGGAATPPQASPFKPRPKMEKPTAAKVDLKTGNKVEPPKPPVPPVETDRREVKSDNPKVTTGGTGEPPRPPKSETRPETQPPVENVPPYTPPQPPQSSGSGRRKGLMAIIIIVAILVVGVIAIAVLSVIDEGGVSDTSEYDSAAIYMEQEAAAADSLAYVDTVVADTTYTSY